MSFVYPRILLDLHNTQNIMSVSLTDVRIYTFQSFETAGYSAVTNDKHWSSELLRRGEIRSRKKMKQYLSTTELKMFQKL